MVGRVIIDIVPYSIVCRSGNHFSRISGGGLEYILTKSLRGILSSQGPPGASLSPKGQVLLCTRHTSFLVQPALLSTASPSAALWGPLALQRHPPVQFCSEAQTSMPLPPFMFRCRIPLPRNPFLPCFELENLTQPCPFGNKDTGSKGEDVNIHRIPSLSPEPSSSTPLLSRASVTARAGVLVPGPALLLTLAPITPEHGFPGPDPRNHDSGGPKWDLESVLSETILAVLSSTRVWGPPGKFTPAPLCSPVSFHPGPGVSSHCRESQRVTQRRPRPTAALDAGEPATARPQRTASRLLWVRAYTKGKGG